MFVIDTNIISELRKIGSQSADPAIAAWAEAMNAEDLYLSAITVLELELGVLRMERRDPRQGAALRAWLDHQVLAEFRPRILPVDTVVAQRCAALHVPDPRSERDALIAATALVHGMTVVTRNVADFEPAGVAIMNPWEATP